MNIITLRITPYKDKDIIVNAVGEEGPITFKVMGALAPHNKYAYLSSPLLFGDAVIDVSKKSKHNILKEFNLKLNVYPINAKFDYLIAVQGLAEISNKIVLEDELNLIYDSLYKSLCALKNGIDPKLVLIKYLIDVTMKMGYELNVKECVRCGKRKNIVRFSFIEGGFICRDCLKDDDLLESSNLNKEQMLTLRSLYLIQQLDDLNKLIYKEDDLMVLFHQFDYFIRDNFDVELNCLKNIN